MGGPVVWGHYVTVVTLTDAGSTGPVEIFWSKFFSFFSFLINTQYLEFYPLKMINFYHASFLFLHFLFTFYKEGLEAQKISNIQLDFRLEKKQHTKRQK